MFVINQKKTREDDAKKRLRHTLFTINDSQNNLDKSIEYASGDRLSFDENERTSLYNYAKQQVDRLSGLSALLQSNRDIYEAEYGTDYVNELMKFASQGSTYGEIAERVRSKNNYASQFADESDYNNWQQYGGLTRPMLKTVSEKLEKDYANAKKSGNSSAMDSTKNSLAWVNSRIKSMTDVGSMTLEEMQDEKKQAKDNEEFLREKADAEAMLQLMESTKLADQQNGTFDEEKYNRLKRQVAELNNITNSDIAYFDDEGNAISWDKAIGTKIRGSYKDMSLEDIEAKRQEAAANLENSKTKFLGVTMPSGETTSAQATYDAWESAYQVKKAEEYKKNSDWEEKSKPVVHDKQIWGYDEK